MKNGKLAGVGWVLLLLWTASAALWADEEKTQTQPQTEVIVTHNLILQGTYSGVREPVEQVIQSKKEFEELWKKHVSVLVPQPPVPQVNFDTSVVVAIFSGEKSTSGYQIRLKDVESKVDDVVVHYRHVSPPENSFLLQVLTQPFLLLRVDKPKGKVQLLKE